MSCSKIKPGDSDNWSSKPSKTKKEKVIMRKNGNLRTYTLSSGWEYKEPRRVPPLIGIKRKIPKKRSIHLFPGCYSIKYPKSDEITPIYPGINLGVTGVVYNFKENFSTNYAYVMEYGEKEITSSVWNGIFPDLEYVFEVVGMALAHSNYPPTKIKFDKLFLSIWTGSMRNELLRPTPTPKTIISSKFKVKQRKNVKKLVESLMGKEDVYGFQKIEREYPEVVPVEFQPLDYIYPPKAATPLVDAVIDHGFNTLLYHGQQTQNRMINVLPSDFYFKAITQTINKHSQNPLEESCEECGSVYTAYDELRAEKVCPKCGLVGENCVVENLKHNAYHGYPDNDNPRRSGDYGVPKIIENWKDSRKEENRAYWKDRYYHDRLIDSLDKKDIISYALQKKLLGERLKNEGSYHPTYEWQEIHRRRPPRKKGNETEEERKYRQKSERDKDRKQRLNRRMFALRSYCNEHELPKWVYDEVLYILKLMPKKFDMQNLHSRMPHDKRKPSGKTNNQKWKCDESGGWCADQKITIGLILFVLERTFPHHRQISSDQTITSAQYQVIKRNLIKLLDSNEKKSNRALYNFSATY